MTLYAVRPVAPDAVSDADEDGPQPEVVFQHEYGWKFLDHAITLWRLVDRQRADDLEAIRTRAQFADPDGWPRFEPAEVAAIARLLTGLDKAIVTAGLVDADWRAPLERLEALAPRVPAMNLDPTRPRGDREMALAEVMGNAVLVRNFFINASRAGCAVILG